MVLAASVLLASCSQDEVMTDTGPDGLVPVTLSVAVGDGVQTRTASADNDEDAKYCYVQVCQSDGTAYTGNDYATPIALTDDDNDGKFTGNIFLKPGEDYVFLFWADNVTNTAPADLHSVAYQKESIAFADRVEQTISLNAPTVNATLQHVVAKVTLKTTTNVEAGSEITVTVPTTYTAYNVEDEAPITEATDIAFDHTVTSAITGTTDGAEVFSFYALVDEANQDLTLANGTNSQQVTNVPLAPNKHTTLVGDVENLGLTNVTFTASIDEIWGNEETVDILGYNYDAVNNTYNITSEKGLRAMAEFVNGGQTDINITLAKDITLTEVWTPIGNSSNQYAGTFDGDNHTITGLTLNAGDYIGLFGEVGGNGTVKNLKLTNVNVSGNISVGAVVGWNEGTISGCSVSGNIKGSQTIGGVAGTTINSNITDCSVEGTVTGTGEFSKAGGIIGNADRSRITECHSSAMVEGNSIVGGIVGRGMNNSNITACYATGEVKATIASGKADAGGVVGHMVGNTIITACYSTGNVTAENGSNVGGVIGYSYISTTTSCYHASGDVTGTGDAIGGVLGIYTILNEQSIGGVVNCYWSGTVSTDKGVGITEIGTAEATKVDGDWMDAVTAMNAALADDCGWEWTIETPNALPTLKKKEIN